MPQLLDQPSPSSHIHSSCGHPHIDSNDVRLTVPLVSQIVSETALDMPVPVSDCRGHC